jgi:hypothetical protein
LESCFAGLLSRCFTLQTEAFVVSVHVSRCLNCAAFFDRGITFGMQYAGIARSLDALQKINEVRLLDYSLTFAHAVL